MQEETDAGSGNVWNAMKLLTVVVDCATEQQMCVTLSPIKQPHLEEELDLAFNNVKPKDISIVLVNSYYISP